MSLITFNQNADKNKIQNHSEFVFLDSEANRSPIISLTLKDFNNLVTFIEDIEQKLNKNIDNHSLAMKILDIWHENSDVYGEKFEKIASSYNTTHPLYALELDKLKEQSDINHQFLKPYLNLSDNNIFEQTLEDKLAMNKLFKDFRDSIELYEAKLVEPIIDVIPSTKENIKKLRKSSFL